MPDITIKTETSPPRRNPPKGERLTPAERQVLAREVEEHGELEMLRRLGFRGNALARLLAGLTCYPATLVVTRSYLRSIQQQQP